jgi:hypothetical protein
MDDTPRSLARTLHGSNDREKVVLADRLSMEKHAWIYRWLRSKNAIKRKEMREQVQRACKVAILGSG